MDNINAGLVFARGVTKFLVGGSVARVTAQVIKNNVKAPENRREKIRLVIATATLSGIAADLAKDRVHKSFNEFVEFANKLKSGELKNEIQDTWAEATEPAKDKDVETAKTD